MVTAADHANTVREALDGGWHPVREDGTRVETQRHRDALAALDALEAQAESKGAAGWARAMARSAELERRAEAAEAERDRLEAKLEADDEAWAAVAAELERLRDAEKRADRLADAARAVNGDGVGEFNTRTSALLALRAALAETERTP